MCALFFPWQSTSAQLDKNFRENFTQISQQQCSNSISYKVDDEVGFEKNEENVWECSGGKCKEYQTVVNCLFNDAFESAVNKTNDEIKDYTGVNFSELHDAQINTEKECEPFILQSIQQKQESLKFTSDCDGEDLGKFYSTCRVTETILNELCGYQNFLTAKSSDQKSFGIEEKKYDSPRQNTDFTEKSDQYLLEMGKAQQSFIETSTLYKNFIHNYRIHSWLVVIKSKLNSIKEDWGKIHMALETFPSKFNGASSIID